MNHIIQKIRRIHLNTFDYLIILALIIILSIFLYLRISKKTEWINVRITIANDEWWWEGQPPQYWYVDSLEKGQAVYNTFGEKTAEIINIESFDIGGYRRRAFIDIKLKGSFDTNRKLYLYNFQPLQTGKPIDLTFGKNNIKGLVTYIDDEAVKYVDKQIEVKLLKIRPWIADSYKEGLQMKDSLGRELAKIDEVIIHSTRYYEFSDLRGQMIEVTNPEFRDVTIKLTIKTFQSTAMYYFVDRAAIKIGEEIWFQFPNDVVRSAQITRIF